MVRWIAIGFGVVLALLIAVFAVGSFLPATHTVARSLALREPADTVWAVVADLASQPAWRHDLRRVTRDSAAAGEVWRETDARGTTLALETAVREPPSRLVRVVRSTDAPFSGQWEIRLAPAPGGCRVTVTETATVPNPVFRFVSRFVLGQSSSVDHYLSSLAARFGEPARIS